MHQVHSQSVKFQKTFLGEHAPRSPLDCSGLRPHPNYIHITNFLAMPLAIYSLYGRRLRTLAVPYKKRGMDGVYAGSGRGLISFGPANSSGNVGACATVISSTCTHLFYAMEHYATQHTTQNSHKRAPQNK